MFLFLHWAQLLSVFLSSLILSPIHPLVNILAMVVEATGPRIHLWKAQLAELAEKTGPEIHVSHFPPDTSKWNKIEHKLFCFTSKNWAGQPLIDIETVINLIGATTTQQGLKVKCVLDENEYPTGIKVSDEDYSRLTLSESGLCQTGTTLFMALTALKTIMLFL